MKVRCINANGFNTRLTEGRIYDLLKEDKTRMLYTINDDIDDIANYLSCLFEIVEENAPSIGLDVLEVTDTQHTRPSAANGIKHDSGKLKPTLLLDDMPLAIQEVLRVLKFGAEKYSEGNWLKVDNGINRYRNAADRHRLACAELDEESQLLHLAHEATSVLMLLELKLRSKQ